MIGNAFFTREDNFLSFFQYFALICLQPKYWLIDFSSYWQRQSSEDVL